MQHFAGRFSLEDLLPHIFPRVKISGSTKAFFLDVPAAIEHSEALGGEYQWSQYVT